MHDLLRSLQEVLGERYQLAGELGRGGMATVYRARDVKHDRDVAVKVLSPDMASVLGRERFLREITIAAGLSHPHIVPLYDSGGEGDVLFFVMPLITGESLRDRLDREAQLPLDEALAIARDVAEALGHAHAQGVVHRDIKPENILLTGGRAQVADFGIARALATVDSHRLTEQHIVIGTAAYMSPEQASGSYLVDGRADLYSLGCVLYEMLAGHPPFGGRTTEEILRRQMTEAAPPMHPARPTVSPALEQVVATLLAKVPADRYASAAKVTEALDVARAQQALVLPGPSWKSWAKLGAAGAVLVAAVWLLADRFPVGAGSVVAADTSRFVILPVQSDSETARSRDLQQLLRDAFTRWEGITVVDPFQVNDALAQRRDRPLGAREALQVATQLGAGRFIRPEFSAVGDSIRVRAALFDVSGRGLQLAEGTERVAGDLRGADSVVAVLVDRLLLREASGTVASREVGTRSLPARQAFVRGQAAIARWDLAEADSAFAAAGSFDPRYAEASLWLALARWWSERPVPTWHSSAEQAVAGVGKLSGRDSVLAVALAAQARGDVVRSCATFGQLAQRSPFDFSAWYAWATCLRRDSLVVRDRRSPSTWRFRSSYHQALVAYRRALVMLPSVHRSLRAQDFQSIRTTLMVSGRQMRQGWTASPDTGTFAAAPGWGGDTVQLIPYPLQDFVEARPWTAPATSGEATRHARESFREIAATFVAAFPNSADALEAIALSLELLGDPACLDSLRRARALSVTREERARLAGAEAWVRLKFAIPDEVPGVQGARSLADSLLTDFLLNGIGDPRVMAGLAALTGRANTAATLSRIPGVASRSGVPAPLVNTAQALLTYAALGGPTESLTVLEGQTARAIAARMPIAEQPHARYVWLVRPATLALPSQHLASLGDPAGTDDYLAQAAAAYLRGDSTATRDTLARVRAARRSSSPSDMATDALYPEAWLLTAIGERDTAAASLDRLLGALAATAPGTFVDPVRSGTLVQAIALRADLAARKGDTATARRWATVVTILWSDADGFLQPSVARMRGYQR